MAEFEDTLNAILSDPDTMGQIMALAGKLGGEPPVSGAMPVIFSPEAMSSLLGVFSSIFSSENVQKGLSQLSGKEGEVIAAVFMSGPVGRITKEKADQEIIPAIKNAAREISINMGYRF